MKIITVNDIQVPDKYLEPCFFGVNRGVEQKNKIEKFVDIFPNGMEVTEENISQYLQIFHNYNGLLFLLPDEGKFSKRSLVLQHLEDLLEFFPHVEFYKTFFKIKAILKQELTEDEIKEQLGPVCINLVHFMLNNQNLNKYHFSRVDIATHLLFCASIVPVELPIKDYFWNKQVEVANNIPKEERKQYISNMYINFTGDSGHKRKEAVTEKYYYSSTYKEETEKWDKVLVKELTQYMLEI